MSTIAMYYFQGELGESMEYPNAFVIPKTSQPTFELFLNHFPIADTQELHFRFRKEDASCGYVWIDVFSPSDALPFYQECIMAKILRINEAATQHRKVLLKRKKKELLSQQIAVPLSAPVDAEVQQRNEFSESGPKPPPYRDYDPQAAQAKPERKPPVQQRQASNPQHQSAPSHPTETNNNTEAADILSFEESPRGGGRTPPPAPSSATPTPQSEPKELDREKLREAKEQGIQDKVNQALEEKKEKDRMANKEQQDFDEAKEKHEAKLLAWSTNNKEKRNIRTLLSTMHTVLWDGTRWKAIGLGDVLEPRQVKLQYRKAMLVVHTDHCMNLTNEQKFVAKRIFEAVNEAYNEFLKKENVA